MRERNSLNLMLSFRNYRPWAVAAFLVASLVGIVPSGAQIPSETIGALEELSQAFRRAYESVAPWRSGGRKRGPPSSICFR